MTLNNKFKFFLNLNFTVMKKYFIFTFFVIFISFLFSSCGSSPASTTTVTTIKTTITEPGSNGFVLKKVIKGDTVWGYSQETYGTGVEWRQIVAENPFLNQPGRIYYDQAKNKWIVLIYPGETIKIGGKYVSPTFISEETTTATTINPSTGLASIPWWGWLLIIASILFFVWLFWFYRNGNTAMAWASSSAAVHVNVMNNIDRDTRAALLGREQDRRDRLVDVIHRDTKKGRIKGFFFHESDEDGITINAGYRRPGEKAKQKKDETKSEEKEN